MSIAYSESEVIYEVWVTGRRDTFRKLPQGEVEQHILDQLEDINVGETLHIVKHLKSEYTTPAPRMVGGWLELPATLDPRD